MLQQWLYWFVPLVVFGLISLTIRGGSVYISVAHQLLLPYWHNLRAPFENQARLFFLGMLLALGFELLNVKILVVVFLASLNKVSHSAITDYKLVWVCVVRIKFICLSRVFLLFSSLKSHGDVIIWYKCLLTWNQRLKLCYFWLYFSFDSSEILSNSFCFLIAFFHPFLLQGWSLHSLDVLLKEIHFEKN